MEFKNNPDKVVLFKSADRETFTWVYRTYVDEVAKMLTGGFTFNSKGDRVRFAGYRRPYQLQEAIQETFLKAFGESARRSYDGTRPYAPYLMQIAKNVVIDGFRKESLDRSLFVMIGHLVYENETEEEAIGRLGQQHAESPEDLAAKNQIHVLVRVFVDELGPEDQQIVNEHLAGDASQSEIAELMGVDRNEIRRRIKSIREGLLKHLKAHRVIEALDPKLVLEILLVSLR